MENGKITLEDKLAAFEQELVDYQTAEQEFNNGRYEVNSANQAFFKNFFENQGIKLPFKRISKDQYWKNSNVTVFELTFDSDTNDTWGNVTAEFHVSDAGMKVVKMNTPSKGASNYDGIELEPMFEYFANVSALMALFQKSDLLIEAFKNYKETERKFIERNEYAIKGDINSVKEQIRVRDLDFRVGTTLMCDTSGPSKRYGNHWQKITITKINPKSVKYVILYERDGITKVGSEQVIMFNYRFFRSVAEHEAIMAEKEAARKARFN